MRRPPSQARRTAPPVDAAGRDRSPRLAAVAVEVGDEVAWTNASYVMDTAGCGEIVHICGGHAVVINLSVARSHPQISPYVLKPLTELRRLRAELAA